jgi:hypothetical protein
VASGGRHFSTVDLHNLFNLFKLFQPFSNLFNLLKKSSHPKGTTTFFNLSQPFPTFSTCPTVSTFSTFQPFQPFQPFNLSTFYFFLLKPTPFIQNLLPKLTPPTASAASRPCAGTRAAGHGEG